MIVAPTIVAPDSSHWAKWCDAANSSNTDRRNKALNLHDRLLNQGRIPFLSWHHLEELLGIENEEKVESRLSFLRSIPLIAWMRPPNETVSLGSVIDILTFEAIAKVQGHSDAISVRDFTKNALLKIGPGAEAIGSEDWVWKAIRPEIMKDRRRRDLTALVGPIDFLDDDKTFGELAAGRLRTKEETNKALHKIHHTIHQDALGSEHSDSAASEMADCFLFAMLEEARDLPTSPREVLTQKLIQQGVLPNEICDDLKIGELSELALLRSQLRIIADRTGYSFKLLQNIGLGDLPSQLISGGLRKYGQKRSKRRASDLSDRSLGVLGAYCDELYVDKRTAEDFRRVSANCARTSSLVGKIVKASDFDHIAP